MVSMLLWPDIRNILLRRAALKHTQPRMGMHIDIILPFPPSKILKPLITFGKPEFKPKPRQKGAILPPRSTQANRNRPVGADRKRHLICQKRYSRYA